MTAGKILSTAAAYIGVKEDPPDSNHVIFNTAYYGREVSGSAYPWCCAFQWYIFHEAGASELFYGGGKTASCTSLMNYAKNTGKFVAAGYKPGDLVLFNWDGGKNSAQHVGIIESVNADGTLNTIEGNTAIGNDSNGGEVMRRVRSLPYVVGAYRPDYESEKAMTWEEIIKKTTGSPDKWKEGISAAVGAAKADGNLGALEIFQYLPELIVKIYNGGE